MPNIQVAILNQSTVLTDAQVSAVIPALQTQVHDHFAPAWGIDADLTFIPANGTPASGQWWIVILDNSDQAGALGYHDLTTEGLPMGKVFAGTDLQFGSKWTVTVSHELLEMLGDPDIDLTVFAQTSDTAGTLYSYENCDACEADQYGYDINGVTVSDFVYPSWFETFRQPNSTQFDYQNHITAPLQLLPGGYIGIFNVTGGNGWTQLTADRASRTYQMRAPVGSRRERRRTTRDRWMRSEIGTTTASK
jgi:hypothetical protein